MEGLEFYKGSPTNKAVPSEFGIYSIKQRELNKTAQANLLASTTTTMTTAAAAKSPSGTTAYDDIIMENTNSVQTLKLKDRVRNISQKVDSIKLNDGKVASNANRKCLQRDENKNTTLTALPTSTTTTTIGKKLMYPSIANNNNNINNNNNDEVDSNQMCNNKLEKSGGQTQGDTLNQIKAMRRQRQSRLTANSSSTAV